MIFSEALVVRSIYNGHDYKSMEFQLEFGVPAKVPKSVYGNIHDSGQRSSLNLIDPAAPNATRSLQPSFFSHEIQHMLALAYAPT